MDEGDDMPSHFMWHNWEACTDKHLHFGKDCVFLDHCHQGRSLEGGYVFDPDQD